MQYDCDKGRERRAAKRDRRERVKRDRFVARLKVYEKKQSDGVVRFAYLPTRIRKHECVWLEKYVRRLERTNYQSLARSRGRVSGGWLFGWIPVVESYYVRYTMDEELPELSDQ